MSDVTIEVKQREDVGTNASRRLRNQGLIPAVVYGGGKETVSIHVERKGLLDKLKGHASDNTIFLLKMAGSGKERHAMIRNMQLDPVSRSVVHIDFQRILMTEKVRVQVPIELVGTAFGVKTEGGVLDFVNRELQIECLPGDIPKHIDLDVTDLHVGQHVEAGALTLPKGVTLLDDADKVIVSLAHARAEEAPEPAAATAEPEVLKQKKTEG
ncbi:MAG TPA: 50S ribosomal protein L25 [Thermoanaerobaculia bacterium]